MARESLGVAVAGEDAEGAGQVLELPLTFFGFALEGGEAGEGHGAVGYCFNGAIAGIWSTCERRRR